MDENLIGSVLNGILNRENNDGFAGGSGMWVILLIILFMGGGFGNINNRANADYVTQAQMSNAFDFNQLQNSVTQTNDAINGVDKSILNQTNALNQTMFGLNQRMSDIGANLANEISQGFCGINRNIDGVNYNSALNTAKINEVSTANTQKVLDAICGLKSDMKDQTIAQLRSDLQAAQLTLGNANQTAVINANTNSLKPPVYLAPYGGYYGGTTIA